MCTVVKPFFPCDVCQLSMIESCYVQEVRPLASPGSGGVACTARYWAGGMCHLNRLCHGAAPRLLGCPTNVQSPSRPFKMTWHNDMYLLVGKAWFNLCTSPPTHNDMQGPRAAHKPY